MNPIVAIAPLTPSTSSTLTTENKTAINETVATHNQSETVSLSPESQQQLRQEQYKMKDATDLFKEWLAFDVSYPLIMIPSGSSADEGELLPENQPLLESLKQKMKNTPDPEQRMGIYNKLNLLRGAGKAEIFTSESDLDLRMNAINDSVYLQQKYLTEKYGSPMGIPSESMQKAMAEHEKNGDLNQHPWLGDLTGKHFSADAPPEVQALFEPKKVDLTEFNRDDFLMELFREREKVNETVSKRVDSIMNDFSHPYWDASLKTSES